MDAYLAASEGAAKVFQVVVCLISLHVDKHVGKHWVVMTAGIHFPSIQHICGTCY